MAKYGFWSTPPSHNYTHYHQCAGKVVVESDQVTIEHHNKCIFQGTLKGAVHFCFVTDPLIDCNGAGNGLREIVKRLAAEAEIVIPDVVNIGRDEKTPKSWEYSVWKRPDTGATFASKYWMPAIKELYPTPDSW